MEHDITVLQDESGLALIGEGDAIDRFLADHELSSQPLSKPALASVLGGGAALMGTGVEIGTQSGRWIKLTEGSAKALAGGVTMKGSSEGVSRAILVNDKNRTKMILEFVNTPGTSLANPAVLSGAAGLMAQLAMQQTMAEVTAYLATIDAKLDDVLRNQKNTVVAELIGVGLVIDEAMTIRDEVGRVSEITWSKVQATASTIASTQAYALTQISDLATKLEQKSRMGELVDATEEAQSRIREWLSILARCLQLQDALGVLELDALMNEASPELDHHREGLRKAREYRLDRISGATERLLARVGDTARLANDKVLFNPIESPDLFRSSNEVAAAILDFKSGLGIGEGRQALEARRWRTAVGDVGFQVRESGAKGVDSAKRFGTNTARRLRSQSQTTSAELVERARVTRDRFRRQGGDTPS